VILTLGANAAVMLFAGWMLRRAAERAREIELRRLRTLRAEAHTGYLAALSGAGGKPAYFRERLRQISGLIKEIADLREGAFAAWQSHPVIGALLVPSSGAGILILLDALSKMGMVPR
jgi:hypothetical protein